MIDTMKHSGPRTWSAKVRSAARHPAGRAARRFAKRASVTLGSGLNRVVGRRVSRRCGILMYHRVADVVPGYEPPTWNTPPAEFRQQLVGLLERGFEAWPLRRVIEEGRRGYSVPTGVFVVTFDDGHESVFRYAYPILQELQVPATLFLPTAYMSGAQPFPFEDWSAAGWQSVPADAWRPMTDQQCRQISASGLVDLGAHTHTHQDFTSRPDEFAADMAANVEALEERYGVRRATFAYPFGRSTPPMMQIARELGLSCALTTVDTLVDSRKSPFGWGRLTVEPWDTAATLAGRLNGWCTWATALKGHLAGAVRGELVTS